jgi:hypothetical protein
MSRRWQLGVGQARPVFHGLPKVIGPAEGPPCPTILCPYSCFKGDLPQGGLSCGRLDASYYILPRHTGLGEAVVVVVVLSRNHKGIKMTGNVKMKRNESLAETTTKTANEIATETGAES